MVKKYSFILLVLVILFSAFLIRFVNINQVPAGLYYDEIDAGYQARSLLETGKDYRGTLSPFFVNSFLDPRPPIPIYVTMISTAIFSGAEYEVRMGSVILGTINVLLLSFLLRQWIKNKFVFTVGLLVAATSPWWIQFSRYNHESHVTAFFILLTLIFFCKGIKDKNFKLLITAMVTLALTMYTYRTMSLFSPIILVLLAGVFRDELFRLGFKKILLLITIYLAITVPFIYATTFAAADKPRIGQISIASDQRFPVEIQRSRELDSGDLSDSEIGKTAVKTSYLFHNKPERILREFSTNYLNTFSVDFLFINGDKNHRHMIPGQGMLLYTDIIALSFGLYYLFKNRHLKYSQLILWLFFLSPIPSSITQDGAAHGSRLFVFTIPLLLTMVFGWYFFYQTIKKFHFARLYYLLVVSCFLLFFFFYFHYYQSHFYYVSAGWYGFPYKQAIQRIMTLEKNYSHIILSPRPDPPNLYLLFWGNISPKDAQTFGTNYSEFKNDGSFLDKFKVEDVTLVNRDVLSENLKPDTLYLVTQMEWLGDLRDGKKPPKGIKLLDIITYPDMEIAFYLIQKNQSDQTDPAP